MFRDSLSPQSWVFPLAGSGSGMGSGVAQGGTERQQQIELLSATLHIPAHPDLEPHW